MRFIAEEGLVDGAIMLKPRYIIGHLHGQVKPGVKRPALMRGRQFVQLDAFHIGRMCDRICLHLHVLRLNILPDSSIVDQWREASALTPGLELLTHALFMRNNRIEQERDDIIGTGDCTRFPTDRCFDRLEGGDCGWIGIVEFDRFHCASHRGEENGFLCQILAGKHKAPGVDQFRLRFVFRFKPAIPSGDQ